MYSDLASNSKMKNSRIEYSQFLELLKQARKDAQLTQTEAAKKLGKHQSFVAKCESGERRVDVIELACFARIYGKSVSFFLKKEKE